MVIISTVTVMMNDTNITYNNERKKFFVITLDVINNVII